MAYRTVKLSEVLKHRKSFITISDDVEYKRCRVQLHRRGVELRDKVLGSAINTKKQQVCKTGDFIVAEMDAKFGGYGFIGINLDGAIVSSHYYLFEVDQMKLIPEFLATVNKTDFLQNQIKAKGSTNYSAVRPSDVLSWEIPLPPIEAQREIVKVFTAQEANLLMFQTELDQQDKLLKKLQQAILQDAVQGKLTEKFRMNESSNLSVSTETGADLLARIRAEKAALIAAKKLKREKPLPPVTDAEKPFDLPESWVWCRLGEVTNNRLGKMLDAIKNRGVEYPYLRNLNVQWYNFKLGDILEMKFENHEIEEYSVNNGDLLICEGGEPGRCAIWEGEDGKYKFQKALHRVRFYANIPAVFYAHYLFWLCSTKQIEEYFTGSGIQHFTGKSLNLLPIPLPPLAEQQAIVEVVERALGQVGQLQAALAEQRETAGALLKALLHRAFNVEEPAAVQA